MLKQIWNWMIVRLQRLLLGDLTDRLQAARKNEQNLTQLNQELRELQASLVERVTALRQTEQSLRQNEIRYRALFERTNDAVFIIGLDDTIVAANSQVCQMLGYTEEELVGKSPTSIIVPEEQEQSQARYQALFDGKLLPLYERTYIHKDGTRIQAELNVAMVYDDEGKPMHIQSIVRDITKRKQAEQALQKSEAMYRQAIEAIGGVPYFDDYRTRSYTFMGEGVRQLTGYSPEEISPRTWRQLTEQVIMLGEANNLTHEQAIRRAKSGELKTWALDSRILTRDGQTRWIKDSAVQLFDDNGTPYASIGILQDVTEHYQIQAEQAKLIAELEAKNAELERFAYTISHDLKSPLITIRGFLGYLEQDAKAGNVERIHADMARITTATDKMQRLLNDLLELSRIGRIMNPPTDVPFNEIVREAIDLVQGRLSARQVHITVADNLPTVHGDRARLVEVVQNLIDNAAKFTGNQVNPQIEIGVHGTDRDGKPIFFVQDNGIGIEPQYHARVFGLFNKLDARSEGTGVGLALVKRIVEVHGGRIWVRSAGQGTGSKFFFTLPANRQHIWVAV